MALGWNYSCSLLCFASTWWMSVSYLWFWNQFCIRFSWPEGLQLEWALVWSSTYPQCLKPCSSSLYLQSSETLNWKLAHIWSCRKAHLTLVIDYVCSCVFVCVCEGTNVWCMEAIEQLAVVSSLLPFEFWGLNSTYQVWQQAPLPAETSCRPGKSWGLYGWLVKLYGPVTKAMGWEATLSAFAFLQLCYLEWLLNCLVS